MLNLFRQDELPLKRDEALAKSRAILLSYLNKGIIPSWETFFADLPVFEGAEDLDQLRMSFTQLTEWPFLGEVLAVGGTEYFFHGPRCSQVQGPGGEKKALAVDLGDADWQLWLEILSLHFKQNWNVQNPFCSFYGELFGKTYRISLIHGSTSPLGVSKLVLRSLATTPHPLRSFGDEALLKDLVARKRNVLVAGATGSGKTSLLSALLEEVDPDEHLVILEDTFEISCSHPHQTRFLSGDSRETSLRAYLSYSLRLSPDRIILGEMRSHEVVPFLLAMNTGHRGLLGTLHASSAVDGLHRAALLFSLYAGEANLTFEKVQELLCRNLEYVVFLERKRVKEVIRILGSDRGTPFYETVVGGTAEPWA